MSGLNNFDKITSKGEKLFWKVVYFPVSLASFLIMLLLAAIHFKDKAAIVLLVFLILFVVGGFLSFLWLIGSFRQS